MFCSKMLDVYYYSGREIRKSSTLCMAIEMLKTKCGNAVKTDYSIGYGYPKPQRLIEKSPPNNRRKESTTERSTNSKLNLSITQD